MKIRTMSEKLLKKTSFILVYTFKLVAFL